MTEGAYAPYNFTNEAGELDGFDVELGNELCRRAKLECTWIADEWDGVVQNLIDGKYDVIMSGMYITAERDEEIDFTQPYFPPAASVYIALAGAGDDVVKGKVATQVATVHSDYLVNSGVTPVEFAFTGEAVAAVLSRRADTALAEETVFKDYVEQSQGQLIFVGPQLVLGSGVGAGVRETDGKLQDTLNKAISAMKDDGSLNTLIEKWFGEDIDTF
jgi:polar amino acid transport system substrate-binding protein